MAVVQAHLVQGLHGNPVRDGSKSLISLILDLGQFLVAHVLWLGIMMNTIYRRITTDFMAHDYE